MALLEAWPTPAPLEGVKSRKRAIFQATQEASVPLQGGEAVPVSGAVALTLNSRVAAVSEAGRALVAALLGEQELASGRVVRHEALAIAHLGPNLVRAKAGGAGGNYVAGLAAELAATFKRRPQVVVLDEACASDDVLWAKVFHQILTSDALRCFRGALVVRAAALTPAVEWACSKQWSVVGGELEQLELAGDDQEFGAEDAPRMGLLGIAGPDFAAGIPALGVVM